MADVHENIIDFKDGYDTVLGERGDLSWWTETENLIARALIKNAPVMILTILFLPWIRRQSASSWKI